LVLQSVETVTTWGWLAGGDWKLSAAPMATLVPGASRWFQASTARPWWLNSSRMPS
jgi:hypothetical protein